MSSFGTLDIEMADELIVYGMNLFKQLEDPDFKTYRKVLFILLTPMPDAEQTRFLNTLNASHCPREAKAKLIGTEIWGEHLPYLLTEFRLLFKPLIDEMVTAGTHVRDRHSWFQLQKLFITKATMDRLEYPLQLCRELRNTNPNARECDYAPIITGICRHSIDTAQSMAIFWEIQKSKKPNQLIAVIAKTLNAQLDNEAIGTSSSSIVQPTLSITKLVGSLHSFNVLNNTVSFHFGAIPTELFVLFMQLSENTQQSVGNALEGDASSIAVNIVEHIFGGNSNILQTDDRGQFVHKERIKMVTCFQNNFLSNILI